MKVFAVRLKDGQLTEKLYQKVGHAKSASRLKKGSYVVEYDVTEIAAHHLPVGKNTWERKTI